MTVGNNLLSSSLFYQKNLLYVQLDHFYDTSMTSITTSMVIISFFLWLYVCACTVLSTFQHCYYVIFCTIEILFINIIIILVNYTQFQTDLHIYHL